MHAVYELISVECLQTAAINILWNYYLFRLQILIYYSVDRVDNNIVVIKALILKVLFIGETDDRLAEKKKEKNRIERLIRTLLINK